MSCDELQLEEKDVLNSIYDGDDRFKIINDTSFQYKVGDIEDGKSFVIEFEWGISYPNEKPKVNLNAFYNNHFTKEVKQDIANRVLDEADQYLGCAMTYTLIEWTKENFDELVAQQPDKITHEITDSSNAHHTSDFQVPAKEKKIQLSKSQKRRIYDRGGSDAVKGEMPRGFDWVDVVKHLSQTGQSSTATPVS